MRILIVEPTKPPYVSEIEDTLGAMQEIVGGDIEGLYPERNVSIFCNENGKLDGLPPNRSIGDDIIAGTFFICGLSDEGKSVSLTDEQIERYSGIFAEPEYYQTAAQYSDKFFNIVSLMNDMDMALDEPDYNDRYNNDYEDEDEDDLEM